MSLSQEGKTTDATESTRQQSTVHTSHSNPGVQEHELYSKEVNQTPLNALSPSLCVWFPTA